MTQDGDSEDLTDKELIKEEYPNIELSDHEDGYLVENTEEIDLPVPSTIAEIYPGTELECVEIEGDVVISRVIGKLSG